MSREFFANGLGRLLEIVQPGVLCAFDFDGTIAPDVDDPSRARIPPPVLRRLAALTEFAPVAVITRRSIEDVGLHLDFFPHFVIGSCGLEGLPGHERHEELYRSECRAWVQRLRGTLMEEGVEPAIWIEDKACSLAIHYRQADDQLATEDRLLDLIHRAIPEAKVIRGRCMLDVMPADVPDKGTVLRELVSTIEAPAAIYVGDGVCDEAGIKLPGDRMLTVRVDDVQTTAAEFHLQDISEMVPFLDILLKRLSEVMKPVAPKPSSILG